MLVAHDIDGNRIYANFDERYKECFCPECGKPLTHKKGIIKAPHFAHKVDESCPYGKDKDSKSEWHIHMQGLFPNESLEVRFKDGNTGEVHIADVYLKESETVIEFQHSPISIEEFRSRTLFHYNEGRRIVWVFDERSTSQDSECGRLRQEDDTRYQPCHTHLHYKWLRSPRKMLCGIVANGNVLQAARYSVCVFYGEEDIVHRIIGEEFDYSEVVLSVHPIKLSSEMDTDEFFLPEAHWLEESPYKEIIEARNRKIEEWKMQREEANRKAINSFLYRRPTRRGPRL